MVEPKDRNMPDKNARKIEQIREKIITMSLSAKAAHLGSSLSCVEILVAVFADACITNETVHSHSRPRIIMSKGHAAMAYYATANVFGLIPNEMLDSYLTNDSSLWGHVTRSDAAPIIDYSTGSLGHGLGLATGHALAYQLRKNTAKIYCVISDGECNEGSTWEAVFFAGSRKLTNLYVLVDYNRIQSLDFCENVMDPEPFSDKWHSFGWSVKEVSGHDAVAIENLLKQKSDRPTVLLCHTIKGKGLPEIENTISSHYKPATEENLRRFLERVNK